MLFLARSFDRYLREGGKLGFLIIFRYLKLKPEPPSGTY